MQNDYCNYPVHFWISKFLTPPLRERDLQFINWEQLGTGSIFVLDRDNNLVLRYKFLLWTESSLSSLYIWHTADFSSWFVSWDKKTELSINICFTHIWRPSGLETHMLNDFFVVPSSLALGSNVIRVVSLFTTRKTHRNHIFQKTS